MVSNKTGTPPPPGREAAPPSKLVFLRMCFVLMAISSCSVLPVAPTAVEGPCLVSEVFRYEVNTIQEQFGEEFSLDLGRFRFEPQNTIGITVAHGTRGDVQPFVLIARELLAQGKQVIFLNAYTPSFGAPLRESVENMSEAEGATEAIEDAQGLQGDVEHFALRPIPQNTLFYNLAFPAMAMGSTLSSRRALFGMNTLGGRRSKNLLVVDLELNESRDRRLKHLLESLPIEWVTHVGLIHHGDPTQIPDNGFEKRLRTVRVCGKCERGWELQFEKEQRLYDTLNALSVHAVATPEISRDSKVQQGGSILTPYNFRRGTSLSDDMTRFLSKKNRRFVVATFGSMKNEGEKAAELFEHIIYRPDGSVRRIRRHSR